jgi:hypothetical protein
MEAFNFTNLQSLLGEQIEVSDAVAQKTRMKLVAVTQPAWQHHHFDTFSVELEHAESGLYFPCGNYQLRHPGFGAVVLYLSQIAADRYQIVVSRAITPEQLLRQAG